MQTEKRLALSKTEVAQSFGVSRDSVDRAIRRGEIKAIRFGRRVLIPASELDRLMQGAQATSRRFASAT